MSYYSWLQQVVAPYADPNRIFMDVDNALKQYPTLKPRTDHYTRTLPPHPLLIVLSGTIPVSYAQQVFNIPVELWLPHPYPRAPPISYVTPTSEMVLKPSTHVSNDGMFYSPMLFNYWQSNPNVLFIPLDSFLFS
jgi:ESCRT-I complex subunit TSG101